MIQSNQKSVRVVHECGSARLVNHEEVKNYHAQSKPKVLSDNIVKPKGEKHMTFAEAQARLQRELHGVSPSTEAIQVTQAKAKSKPIGPLGSKGLPENLQKMREEHPITFAEAQKRYRKELGIDL